MIRCKPERNPAQIKTIIFICTALLLVDAVIACSVKNYKIVFEVAFVVLAIIIVQLVVRYTLSEMEYEISDGSFSVRKTVGNKSQTVCSLDLSTAISLTPKSEYDEKVKSEKLPYINMRYNYNQNIRCKSSYVYVAEFNQKTIAVEFEPNEPFIEVMLEEIEKAKK